MYQYPGGQGADSPGTGAPNLSPMRRNHGSMLLGLILICAGCGEAPESQAPGAKGPVVLRVWDQQARRSGGQPTVLVTDALHQEAGGFERLRLSPVDIRHPLKGGQAWIHAPSGSYLADGSIFHLDGRVRFHGIQSGQWFAGTATRAEGNGGAVVLFQAELVRGAHLYTSPRLVLSQDRIDADGPFLVTGGSPAVAAALGAWE